MGDKNVRASAKRSVISKLHLIYSVQQVSHYKKEKGIQIKVSPITPAWWCGHHHAHAHNHISRAGIMQLWRAILALQGIISMA